ncbi:MAG: SAM-dependent methyltransferase, partial [Gammaproteobacteria bacterium]|nr:SAM-dependent methyltransferase [Gammaproteobacteria bacterium]
ATAIESLRRQGIQEPGKRLVVMRSWNAVTLLIRNGEFDANDIAALREFARSRSFDMAWFPGIRASDANRFNVLQEPYVYDGATALLGDDAGEFMARYKFFLEPATDDRPYFFHFFKWATLPEIFALRHTGGAGLIEWGYLVLVATLMQAIVAGCVFILLPLASTQRQRPSGSGTRMGVYFLLLGFAFLFVEMAFIQRFILFLSHPLYAVAVVLAAFLVFAGLGSAWSERIASKLESCGLAPIAVTAAVIAALAVLYVALLPYIFQRFMGYPDAAKILISNALIAPLAFAMGVPFPLGLKRVADSMPEFIPWAWGINGFASVVSSVLATLLAIEFGFTLVIVIAVLCYASAALIIERWQMRSPRPIAMA